MTRLALAAALIAFACPALAESDGTRPDPRLTPGEVRTTDRRAICTHSTRTVRHVPASLKAAARRAYGIAGEHDGWCGTKGCEIDHKVPLAVGGGNAPGSLRNLWPQRFDGPLGYPVKDLCEAAVARAMCAGRITVRAAQGVFLGDWTVACRPFVKGL